MDIKSELSLKEIFKQMMPNAASIGYLTGAINDNGITIQGAHMPKEWAGKALSPGKQELDKAIDSVKPSGIVGIVYNTGQWSVDIEADNVRRSREYLASQGLPDFSVQIGERVIFGEEDYRTFPEDKRIFPD